MNLAWWSEHPFEFPLLLLTAVVTHFLMSFSQTLMHYVLGHRRLGDIFYRNHIHYHHVNYSKDHLVSLAYIKNHDDGNNTPFLMMPVALMLSSTYFLFPLGIFLTQIITALVSFCAHVYLDNQYRIVGSPPELRRHVSRVTSLNFSRSPAQRPLCDNGMYYVRLSRLPECSRGA